MRTDRQTDGTKLTVALRNFVNVSKSARCLELHACSFVKENLKVLFQVMLVTFIMCRCLKDATNLENGYSIH